MSSNPSNQPLPRNPVASFRNGYTLEEERAYLNDSDLTSLLSGGDASVWVGLRASEFLRTAVVPNRRPAAELPFAPLPAIGKIEVETKTCGTVSLDDYLVHPDSYAQAFIVVHEGRIAYESYPAMREDDYHLMMSVAKTFSGLAVDLLISDGKIDESQTIGHYVPDFRGSVWEDVRVKDVMDMCPGTDAQENDETRANPDSIAIRAFRAELGFPYKGGNELLIDVLRDARREGDPGEKFEYGSPTTQVLVYLVEAVTGERWAQFVDRRVWSKIGAEAPLLVHTSPDGVSLGHGLLSTRLRDLARFGMLYTPSWNKIASEQVVTSDMLRRIQTGTRSPEFFRSGYDGPVFVDRLNDDSMTSNARQWDAVWPDGDIWKSGIQTQGLYVSPDRDVVIAFYSTNKDEDSLHRYLRPIVASGLFDS